jgi:hypothetical protein
MLRMSVSSLLYYQSNNRDEVFDWLPPGNTGLNAESRVQSALSREKY